MGLVDDDQAQILDRCEHGRARPYDDGRLARSDPAVFPDPLLLGQPTVEHADPAAEAGLNAPDGLRGEGDLGHEQYGSSPVLERVLV